MANLELRIKADFEQASRSFKSLAETSEYTKDKIKNLAKTFSDKHIDDFIDKQKLAEAALTATRGSTEAMQQSIKNYQREIERLIKSGLDPNSEAVKRLALEQKNLEIAVKATTEAQKAQEAATKALEKASKALFAACAAGAAALMAIAQKSSEAGDEIAKTARVVGTTAEALQELRYAAEMSGSSSETLTSSLQKLNKNMGDLQSGSGALRTYLNNNNKALLAQLGTVKSNEEAFNLLMKGIKEAPNEFERAQLAQAAFGKSGQDLINMALAGAEGIAKLREEKRKYGVISQDAAEQAEKYIDAQTRLKASLEGARNEIAKSLAPALTGMMDKIANMISGIENWDEILRVTIVTITSAAVAAGTFIAAMKIGKVISDSVKAIKTLTTVIIGLIAKTMTATTAQTALNTAINPIAGAATAAAVGLAIAAGVTLNYALRQNELNDALEKTNKSEKENKEITQEKIIQLKLLEIEEARLKEIEGEKQKLIAEGKKLSELAISETIENWKILKNKYDQLIADFKIYLKSIGKDYVNGEVIDLIPEKTVEETEKIIKTLQEKLADIFPKNAIEKQRKEYVDQITAALEEAAAIEKVRGQERIDFYQAQEARVLEITEEGSHERIAAERALANLIKTAQEKRFSEELEMQKEYIAEKFTTLVNVEAMEAIQAEAARREQALAFFNERLAQEDLFREQNKEMDELTGNERLEYMKAQQAAILALFDKHSEEYLSANEALEQAITDEINRQAEARKAIKRAEVTATADLFGALSNMVQAFAGENKAALVAAKALASAGAGMNSYLAFTQALGDPTIPSTVAKAIQAATVLASGIAAQVNIIKTPIPSAETGGSFVVPDVSPRVDSYLYRFNKGEEFNVTPRSESGASNGTTANIYLMVDGQVFAKVMNRQIKSGDIRINLGSNL